MTPRITSDPSSPCHRRLAAERIASRSLRLIAALALSLATAGCSAPHPHDTHARDFDYFVAGDPTLPRATHTQPGLALMGGGGAVDAAYRFIADHAGGGHIVILGAQDDDSVDPTLRKYSDWFMTKWGKPVSAETIIFRDRKASFDARVLATLRGADGIFLMGGDQGLYVKYWKGTPIQAILNAHVAAGRPIGGSSAGLAILGHYSYDSLDGGSLESKTALADPFDPSVTLESDFLHYPWLDHVVTDTHFSSRARLGRLIVFAARFGAVAADAFGIGVDEQTALLIDADGEGRVAEGSQGHVWLVMPREQATVLAPGRKLSIGNIRLIRLDPGGSITMGDRAAHPPYAEAVIAVSQGKLTADSIATPIFERDAVPPGED
jgi:cyanophycinase